MTTLKLALSWTWKIWSELRTKSIRRDGRALYIITRLLCTTIGVLSLSLLGDVCLEQSSSFLIGRFSILRVLT
jgi:hypothetical protein